MFRIFFYLSIFWGLVAQSQNNTGIKNGIDKISILPTHHFGMFSGRINQNFSVRPVSKSEFTFSIHSGNNFHPFVEAYLPESPEIRANFAETIWYNRQFNYIDQETTPADYFRIVIDAVFKEFRASFKTRLSSKSELQITIRSFVPTEGHYPFSFFTSDESIEWFHDNIAGGKDPFGRRYYGLNKVDINYTDRNGKRMQIGKNQFVFTGIDLAHHWYPQIKILARNNINLNFGSHLSINTASYNPSTDFGLSANLIKTWALKNKNEFRLGYGISGLCKNLINFGDVMELGNNKLLGGFEAMLEFTKYTQMRNYHAFGLNYQYQTRYSKQTEAGYYFLVGEWDAIHSGWQHGVEQLYKNQSTWNFLYTYGTKKIRLSLYAKQDLLVNNAPDFQTGIGITIPFTN